jgi:hypothetical protein
MRCILSSGVCEWLEEGVYTADLPSQRLVAVHDDLQAKEGAQMVKQKHSSYHSEVVVLIQGEGRRGRQHK